MKFGTKVIHSAIKPDPTTGAIMTPIYQTSTYVQEAPGVHKGHEYSRTSNPTRSVLEKNLASLENANFGRCFASGLSAISAVIHTLSPGDEVVCTQDLYGGTFRLFKEVFRKYGIKSSFIDMQNLENVEKALNKTTKLIWIETPTNPLLNIIDMAGVSDIAHKHGVSVAVDNTFATPYLQTPIDDGADIVMHSITKYIAGHSDLIMGFLATNDKDLDEKFGFLQNAMGAVPGPQDCFLTLRGIKTLHIRMERHCENTKKIAHYLKNHPKIKNVFWPGFEDHFNHKIAKKQMKDFGGMISFELKNENVDAAMNMIKKFQLFTLAESLGGVESLVGYPSGMTHASIPKKERIENGITDTLVRLSVGIEDIDDLIEDIEQAMG